MDAEMAKLNGIMEKLKATSDRSGLPARKETVREQVQARLGLAMIGTTMAAMGRSFFGSKFESAPLLKPPIATGMTETLGKIYSTIMKYGPVGHAELAEIPKLLRRIRHLLRVYYDALITSKKTPEFKYCDMADTNDAGPKLHEAGVFLQLSPVRLRALFSNAPEMEVFLFDDPIDIGKWRLEAEAAVQAVKSDEEADDDRERMIDLE